MARLIKSDGSNTEILPRDPARGFQFEGELYDVLQTDTIQAINLADDSIMLCDENAKLAPVVRPCNKTATTLLHLAGGMMTDVILGDVVVCTREELK